MFFKWMDNFVGVPAPLTSTKYDDYYFMEKKTYDGLKLQIESLKEEVKTLKEANKGASTFQLGYSYKHKPTGKLFDVLKEIGPKGTLFLRETGTNAIRRAELYNFNDFVIF